MNKFFEILTAFTKGRYYRFYFVLALTGTILFFSTPSYQYLPKALGDRSWQVVIQKYHHPFSMANTDDVKSHSSKMNFRITVPLICKIFNLPPIGIYILQFFCGMVFLFLLLKYSEQLLSDKAAAMLLTAAIGFIYTGKSAFVDIYAWFDSFAFLFIISGLLVKGFHWRLLFFIAALFTDERSYLCVILAMLLGILRWEDTGKGLLLNFIHKANNVVIAGICAIIFSAGIRLFLSSKFGLFIPAMSRESGMGFLVLYDTFPLLGLGWWTSLEGLWIVVFASILCLIMQKRYISSMVMLGIIIVVFFASGMVFDQTRSGSYIFVIVFISINILRDRYTLNEMRQLLTYSAIVSFMFPAIMVVSDMSDRMFWFKPACLRLMTYILQ